eukprot:gene10575-10734_t
MSCVAAAGGSRSAVAPAAADGMEQQLSQIEAAKVPGLAGFAAFFVDAGEAPGRAAVEQGGVCDSSGSTSGASGAALSQTSTYGVAGSSIEPRGCQESIADRAGGDAGGAGVAAASPGGLAHKSCPEVADILLLAQVIADELLAAADALESSYRDPYSDPAYSVQLAKVEAKAKREAARATAAAAKAASWPARPAAFAEQ